EVARELYRLGALRRRQLRIAEQPCRPGGEREACDSHVLPDHPCARTMHPRIVQPDRLFQMMLSAGEFSDPKEAFSDCVVRSDQAGGVVQAFGEMQKLLRALQSRSQIPPDQVERPEPKEDRQQIRGLTNAKTKVPSALVDGFHLRSGISLGRHQGRT